MMAQPQNAACPNPVETTELHFKLVKRCNAVQYADKPSHSNLLAVSNTLGLTFLGANDGFNVIRTNSLTNDTITKKFVNARCRFVSHLAVNGDESLLAVAGSLGPDGCVAYIYPLQTIASQNYLQEVNKVKLSSTAGVVVVEMFWNPASFQLLSACLSDGSIILADFKSPTTMEVNSLPANAAARCFCWSPKGKQLVVGGEDGKLTQYKPDLTPAKMIPAPSVFDGAASVASVIWISNFQFGAIYRNRNKPDDSPTLIIVNVFKNEPITFINYGDITYGSTQFRFPQFYFHFQPQWNLMFVSSANSVELAVLHLGQDGRTWQQWGVGDSSRAEMPLTTNQDETFPYGLAVDLSSQTPVPWHETQIAPCPRLLLISNEGVICLYNVVNLIQGAPLICNPPSKIIADSFFDAPVVVKPQPVQIQPSPVQQILPKEEKPVPVAPEIKEAEKVVLKVPEPTRQAPISVPAKAESPPKEKEPSPPVKEPEPEIDDSVYDAAILEEVVALDDDLSSFFIELNVHENDIPPEQEFSDVVKRLEDLAEFQLDVDETTNSQAEEIAELKLEVLEMTAKTQDAQLVNERRNSRLSNQLQRSEHLDPVMARMLREILGLRTYVETQLNQISNHLDKQWEEYQQTCRKDAKKKLETPMMEDVFKTLNLHKKLLSCQKMNLDRLQREIDRGVWNKTDHKNNYNDLSRATELSKLADSLLGVTISEEKDDKLDISKLVINVKKKNIDNNEFTASEITQLFDRFEDATVPEVTHCLNFADREAHKKEISARIKTAADRIKKKKSLEKIAPVKKEVPKIEKPMPKMPVALPVAKTAPSFENAFAVKPVASKSSFGVPKTEISTTTTASGLFSFNKATDVRFKATDATPTPVTKSNLSFTPLSVSETLSVKSTAEPVKTQSSESVKTTPSLFAGSSAQLTGNIFGASGRGMTTTANPTGLFAFVTATTTATESPKPTTATSILSSMLSSTTTAVTTLFGTTTVTSSVAPPSFSTATTTSSRSLFSNVTTKGSSLFGTNTLSDFGQKAPVFGTTAAATTTTTSASIFGSSAAITTTTSASIFGSSAVTSSTSVFGVPASTATTTAVTTSSSAFGSVLSTTSSGLFSATTTPTTTTSLFGSAPATTTGSIFGSTAAVATTTTTATNVFGSSLFGNVPATTTATGLFASFSQTATTTTPVFGTSSANTAAPVFGTQTATTTAPVFGTQTATTTAPSVFGTQAPTTTASVFGTPAPTTTAPSVFGTPSATTAAPVFGTQSPTTTAPVFGTPTSTTAAPSVFGTTAPTTTAPSVFGTPTTTSSTVFGSPTTTSVGFGTPSTTSTAVFGTPTSSAVGGFGSPVTPTSGFGTDLNQTANLFGQMLSSSAAPSTPQTNIFGQAAQKSGFDSGGSIFGGGSPANTGSLFGSTAQATNAFGQTTTPSLFGTPANTSTNIFGQPAVTTTTSSFFGQNICSPFGSGAAAPNQSPFGSPATATTQSAFGSSSFNNTKPIFGASQNVFGQTGSLFGGNTNQTASIFGGNTSGGTFQTNTFSGPFSAGSGTVAQSGFGASSSFAKPATGGFGSAPVFGGAPAASSTFGGTPAFGSAMPFGSPPKVFGGGGTTTSAFGQQQTNSGFESLANQNTVGFGNLAQMPQPQQQGFGTGFAAPQNTFGAQPPQQSSSFGGSSFSSWR